MLDCPGNRSKAFDVQTTEPLFEFCNSLLIPLAINTPQWNCCLGNMANVLHLLGETECENFFRLSMDKHLSLFHQVLLQYDRRIPCKNTNPFHIIQLVFVCLFGYSLFSMRANQTSRYNSLFLPRHDSDTFIVVHVAQQSLLAFPMPLTRIILLPLPMPLLPSPMPPFGASSGNPTMLTLQNSTSNVNKMQLTFGPTAEEGTTDGLA